MSTRRPVPWETWLGTPYAEGTRPITTRLGTTSRSCDMRPRFPEPVSGRAGTLYCKIIIKR